MDTYNNLEKFQSLSTIENMITITIDHSKNLDSLEKLKLID